MKHTLTCFLAAGLMALVGCGGDESGDSGNTTTEDSSASNSSTDTGAAAASNSGPIPQPPSDLDGSTAVATAPKTPVIGQMHPEITGPDTDGVEFNLSDYRGKVVMVDFWGDW